MSKKKILIVGAGITGLSAAWHLQAKGIGCQVLEEQSEAGGLCRSKKISGFCFDYSGHLLHFKNKKNFKAINNLLGCSLAEHRRNASVYSFNRHIPYPFQAHLSYLPRRVMKDCLCGFMKTFGNGKKGNVPAASFLDWVNQTFGSGIARYFFLPYNKKFWTVSPEELTCAWLDGFIPLPKADEIIKGAGGENHHEYGYNARFWYPKAGSIQAVIEALTGSIRNLHVDSGVAEIDIVKKQVQLRSGRELAYDSLVSTIPLPQLFSMLKPSQKQLHAQVKRLRWNSIFNLNLGVIKKDTAGRHWVYFPEKEFCFFRVGFFHNFSFHAAPFEMSSLYAEVSYSPERPFNRKTIIPRIKNDLLKAKILNKKDKIAVEDVNDIVYGYPIYDRSYAFARKALLEFLLKNHIVSCGRYGSWRYMSMEDSFVEGRQVAGLFHS